MERRREIPMMPNLLPRPFKALCLLATGAVVLALVGCGLGDYEALMRQNRSQSKGGEEDRKLLGEPLNLPPIPEGATSAPALAEATVFLRPPKTFKCNSTPKEVCWDTYSPKISKGGNGFVMPGKEKTDQLVKVYGYTGVEGCSVYLAAVVSDNMTLDETDRAIEAAEFKRVVWSAFSAVYIQQRLGKDVALPTEFKQKKKEEVVPPRSGKVAPPPLRFDAWIWEEPDPQNKTDGRVSPEREPARYSLYFYQNGTIQVAIIYQVPRSRANDVALQKEIEASLKTLATGPEGAQMRYRAMKNKQV